MRAVVAIAAAIPVGFGLVGCESTQDKAAKVQAENARRMKLAAMPLTIPKVDSRIETKSSVVLKGKAATAVVVTMRNRSSTAIADIPIAVDVLDSKGSKLQTNTTPGADHWLNHVPLIRAGQTVDWVQDQFDPAPTASRAKVKVGVGRKVTRPYPDAKLLRTKWFSDPISGTAFTGKAKGSAPVMQERVVVYSVGRRGGRVVAAGRGVLEKLAPNGAKTAGFTIFYTGADPKSTSLSNLAPPVLSPKK